MLSPFLSSVPPANPDKVCHFTPPKQDETNKCVAEEGSVARCQPRGFGFKFTQTQLLSQWSQSGGLSV